MSEVEQIHRRDADYHSRISLLESDTHAMKKDISQLGEQYHTMCTLLSSTKTEVVSNIANLSTSVDTIRSILDRNHGAQEAKKGIYDIIFKIISALPIISIVIWAIIQAKP